MIVDKSMDAWYRLIESVGIDVVRRDALVLTRNGMTGPQLRDLAWVIEEYWKRAQAAVNTEFVAVEERNGYEYVDRFETGRTTDEAFVGDRYALAAEPFVTESWDEENGRTVWAVAPDPYGRRYSGGEQLWQDCDESWVGEVMEAIA